MNFTINTKPLSVNKAWKGRRYSTALKTQYENTLAILLPKERVVGQPYYSVRMDFYIYEFSRSDVDNLAKVTLDCIVKRGIISDDKMIVKLELHKYRAEKGTDKINVEIIGCGEGL